MLAFLALSGLTFLLYRPAFSGPFLFDDFPTLDAMARAALIDTREEVLAFIASGNTGPGGRPVAMASFLLDDQSWPSRPWSFKYTNALLHILNGWILFAVCLRLLQLRPAPLRHLQPAGAIWLAASAAGLWMTHPLWVSTTLYVVQRMTLLAATFSLLAIWSYLIVRPRLRPPEGSASRGASGVLPSPRHPSVGSRFLLKWTGVALWMALLAGLALGSKENAVVTVFFLLLIEILLVRPALGRPPLAWRRAFALLVWTPAVMIVGWLCWHGWTYWSVDWTHRDFNAQERLLTQPRVLWSYLRDLLLPRASTGGLFTAVEPLSTALLQPWTTLPAVLGIALLGLAGILLRYRWPLLALAIGVYFSGHVLESTVVGLEMYFEHRNYLPAVFLFLPVVAALALAPLARGLKIGLFLIMHLILLFLLYQRAQLWMHQEDMYRIWAWNSPDSYRAQLQSAQLMMKNQHPEEALRYLQRAEASTRQSVTPGLGRLTLACADRSGIIQARSEHWRKTADQLQAYPWAGSAVRYLQRLIELQEAGQCPELANEANLTRLLDAWLTNKQVRKSATRTGLLLHLKGQVALISGRTEKAAALFNDSFTQWQDIESAMLAVALLGRNSDWQEALALLGRVEEAYRRSPLRAVRDYHGDIELLRRELLRDAAGQTAPDRHQSAGSRGENASDIRSADPLPGRD